MTAAMQTPAYQIARLEAANEELRAQLNDLAAANGRLANEVRRLRAALDGLARDALEASGGRPS